MKKTKKRKTVNAQKLKPGMSKAVHRAYEKSAPSGEKLKKILNSKPTKKEAAKAAKLFPSRPPFEIRPSHEMLGDGLPGHRLFAILRLGDLVRVEGLHIGALRYHAEGLLDVVSQKYAPKKRIVRLIVRVLEERLEGPVEEGDRVGFVITPGGKSLLDQKAAEVVGTVLGAPVVPIRKERGAEVNPEDFKTP